jgi:hypothetical protein
MAGKWTAAEIPGGPVDVQQLDLASLDWRQLWDASEELTGVRYEFAAAPAAS